MGRTKSLISLEGCNDRVYRIVNIPIYMQQIVVEDIRHY